MTSPQAQAAGAPTGAGGPGASEIVRLDDVYFSYPDGTPVIDGVSLGIESGGIVGIVGPSGCGKSTLLSLIAGLVRPSRGTVEKRFGGSDRHPVSMVFQKDTVMPWLSVKDNVALSARFKVHGSRRRFAS